MSKVTPLKKEVPITQKVAIKPLNIARATVAIEGTDYLQNSFSSDNRGKMKAKQEEGSTLGKKRKAKPPKDFQKVYEGSMHVSEEGWYGIPALGIKSAMVDACSLTEVDMKKARMCIDVIADGYERGNRRPLVRLEGTPEMLIEPVRIGMNQTDLAARALFPKWSANVTIEWDADWFTATDIANLVARAGWQVGVGAGRKCSKASVGTGKGRWEVMQ